MGYIQLTIHKGKLMLALAQDDDNLAKLIDTLRRFGVEVEVLGRSLCG